MRKKPTAEERRTALLTKWGETVARLDGDTSLLEHYKNMPLYESSGERRRRFSHITNTKRRIETAEATLRRIEGKLFPEERRLQ